MSCPKEIQSNSVQFGSVRFGSAGVEDILHEYLQVDGVVIEIQYLRVL